MKKPSPGSARAGRNSRIGSEAGQAFHAGLKAFEIEAITACRGFQVAMAVNVFGVGTVLENNLPSR